MSRLVYLLLERKDCTLEKREGALRCPCWNDGPAQESIYFREPVSVIRSNSISRWHGKKARGTEQTFRVTNSAAIAVDIRLSLSEHFAPFHEALIQK